MGSVVVVDCGVVRLSGAGAGFLCLSAFLEVGAEMQGEGFLGARGHEICVGQV